MQKRRLGCLSTTGILTALLALFVVAGVVWARGGIPFSPGPLNAQPGEEMLGGVRSHADIGGECGRCHAAPWSTDRMADRCVRCHTEIGQQLQQLNSLHGALLKRGPLECRACHPEHRGPTAPLTVMNITDFPHEAVGFSLRAHTKRQDGSLFACSDCHGAEITSFDPGTCAACHRDLDGNAFMDAHTQLFGHACVACHDGVDTYGRDFDHNTFFRLEGKHAETACSKCHLGARSLSDLKGTPTDCYACHQKDDAHNGQFGTDCAACHKPTNWQDATIDHNKTNFPLVGKHTQVACEQCHVNNTFKGTPTDCYACHQKDDAHNGQFGTDCAACHTSVAWDQVTFDHNKTNFPLTGQHAQLSCTQCHTNNVFKGTPTQCVACHAEPVYHRGVFGTDCAACHTTTAWSPAQYNEPHTFPINHGARGQNACRVCHPNSLQTYTCYGCHEHTPAKIERKHLKEGITNFQNCVRCHPTGREHEGEGEDDD